MPTELETAAEPKVPELMSQGTYALFRTPQGGLHLSYRAEGEEADQHVELPPALTRMMEAAQRGEKTGMLGMLNMMKGMMQ